METNLSQLDYLNLMVEYQHALLESKPQENALFLEICTRLRSYESALNRIAELESTLSSLRKDLFELQEEMRYL